MKTPIFHIMSALNKYWSFSLFILLMWSCSNLHQSDNLHIPIDILEEGDIVFRRGISSKSQAVMYADKSGKFSHTGIIVKTEQGMKIIHITPDEGTSEETMDRIKMEDIADFFSVNRSEAGSITRLKEPAGYVSKAASYAIKIYERNILFDHDYNLDDTTKMYCTELIWRAYLAAGKDITHGKRSEINNFPLHSGIYIFPSDIYDNGELVTVFEY